MSAHLDEAELASRCGGPIAYPVTSHALILEELADLADLASRLLAQAKLSGELPLCDARVLRGRAQWLETMAERAAIDRLRATPEVLPGSAEDKARQRVVGR